MQTHHLGQADSVQIDEENRFLIVTTEDGDRYRFNIDGAVLEFAAKVEPQPFPDDPDNVARLLVEDVGDRHVFHHIPGTSLTVMDSETHRLHHRGRR